MSRPPHPPPRHSQIPRHIDSIKDNYSDDYDYNNKNDRRNYGGMLATITDNDNSLSRTTKVPVKDKNGKQQQQQQYQQ